METDNKVQKKLDNASVIKNIPEGLLCYIKSKEINETDILLCSKFDLNPDGEYQDGNIIVLYDCLYITTGSYNKDNSWLEKSFARYTYNEFKEINSENYITTGALVAKLIDDSFFCLFSYTNTCQKRIGRAANILSKLIKGEIIEFSDIDNDEDEVFCPKCKRPYRDKERKICDKCMNKGALFVRIFRYSKPYVNKISLIVIGLFCTAGLALLRPILNSVFLYNYVLNPESEFYGKIGELVLLIIAFEIFCQLVAIFYTRISARVAANMVYDIKSQLFAAMQKLSMSFYNSKQTGSLMNRVNSDAINIQYFLLDGVTYFFVNAVQIIVITFIIFKYNALLGVFVFLPAPFIIYFIKKIVPKFYRLRWHRWIKSSKLNSIINDTLTGMRVVKAFGKEEAEVERFAGTNQELYKAQINERVMNLKVFPALSYLMSIGGLFVWLIAGYDVATQKPGTDFGYLIAFTSYVAMVYGPLDFMVNVFDWWANCMTGAQRIFEIIDTKPTVIEKDNPKRIPIIKGKITLKDVKFEYLPNKPVLHGINLEIKTGEMIGLVGHSGAGKSTITNLISRLYDVNEGAILIDDINIKDIAISDLRSQIGMVLQETFLFTGTIAENIAYARPDATTEEIVNAAKFANAHDFIMKTKDGYETKIGVRRNHLSGGELQRISIARAILMNPRILILDEATASVDTETEKSIQEALERLVKGRTTIAIAHRLSTLRNADRLVAVEKGTIAECGTHAELEEKKGVYYNMLEIQKKALKIGGISDDSEQ